MSSRLASTLVVLLAAVVLAGTVLMWADFNDRVEEDTSAVDVATPTPSPTPSPTPTSSPTRREPVDALFVGDGYTAEACETADRLGWECTVDAQQGTGFLRDGSSFDEDFGTLGDRLRDLPAQQPDVVVVDAGRNDLGVYTTAAVLEAMDDFLSRLRARYPDAALVQVVPWTTEEPTSDPAVTTGVEDLMATYDGTAIAASGEPLTGAALADRLRALELGPSPVSGS